MEIQFSIPMLSYFFRQYISRWSGPLYLACANIINISYPFSTLRSEQNGRYFADDILDCILVSEKYVVPWCPIDKLAVGSGNGLTPNKPA